MQFGATRAPRVIYLKSDVGIGAPWLNFLREVQQAAQGVLAPLPDTS
jgi:hypothetical protein